METNREDCKFIEKSKGVSETERQNDLRGKECPTNMRSECGEGFPRIKHDKRPYRGEILINSHSVTTITSDAAVFSIITDVNRMVGYRGWRWWKGMRARHDETGEASGKSGERKKKEIQR